MIIYAILIFNKTFEYKLDSFGYARVWIAACYFYLLTALYDYDLVIDEQFNKTRQNITNIIVHTKNFIFMLTIIFWLFRCLGLE